MLWTGMIAGLSDEDAAVLASKYDFSGGQIEDIARKSVVSRIITSEDFTLIHFLPTATHNHSVTIVSDIQS